MTPGITLEVHDDDGNSSSGADDDQEPSRKRPRIDAGGGLDEETRDAHLES
jgi:hypothetical protein